MPTEEQGLIDATLWPEPGAGVLHEHFEAVTRRRRAAMMAWMSRAIIPVPLLCLSLLAGSSTLRVWAQPVDPHLEDVLHAVFAHIEPDSSVAILSGPGLGPKAAAALRTLIPRALQLPPGMPSSSLPPDAVRVDRVVVTDSRAVVHLTYGPVPAELTWLCGQAITIPLRRTDLWQVLESEARVRCAREGPRGLSREGERLLEAVRLAFSHIGLHPDVRVVADPKLSSSASVGSQGHH